MVKKLFYLLAIAAIDFSIAGAQTITPQEYIDKYKDLAIREMKRMVCLQPLPWHRDYWKQKAVTVTL